METDIEIEGNETMTEKAEGQEPNNNSSFIQTFSQSWWITCLFSAASNFLTVKRNRLENHT